MLRLIGSQRRNCTNCNTLYSSDDEAGTPTEREHDACKDLFFVRPKLDGDEALRLFGMILFVFVCAVCAFEYAGCGEKFGGGHNHVIIYVSSSTLPFLLWLLAV